MTKTDDVAGLVRKLRVYAEMDDGEWPGQPQMRQAAAVLQSQAAEIARLRGEVEEARAALRALLQYEGHHAYCGHGRDIEKPCVCGLMKAHQQARAALAQQGGDDGK